MPQQEVRLWLARPGQLRPVAHLPRRQVVRLELRQQPPPRLKKLGRTRRVAAVVQRRVVPPRRVRPEPQRTVEVQREVYPQPFELRTRQWIHEVRHGSREPRAHYVEVRAAIRVLPQRRHTFAAIEWVAKRSGDRR